MNRLIRKFKNIKISCTICGSDNLTFQSIYRNNSIQFENLNRFLCNDCELVFANPMPNNKILKEYNSNYHV